MTEKSASEGISAPHANSAPGEPIALFRAACLGGNADIVRQLSPGVTAVSIDEKLFCEICRRGHVAVVKWLLETFSVEDPGWEAMRGACAGGHLEIAKLVYGKFQFPRERLSNGDWMILHDAAIAGQTEVAKWLHSVAKLDGQEAFNALRWACRAKEPTLAQWVKDEFKIDSVGGHISKLLWSCASHKNWRMLRWLCATFKPDNTSLFSSSCGVLKKLCYQGDLSEIIWLCEEYHPPRETMIANDNAFLCMLCETGHLEAAKWLVEKYGICRGSAWPFTTACAHGYLEMAKWLHGIFHVTTQEIHEYDDYIPQAVRFRHFDDVREWLSATFGV